MNANILKRNIVLLAVLSMIIVPRVMAGETTMEPETITGKTIVKDYYYTPDGILYNCIETTTTYTSTVSTAGDGTETASVTKTTSVVTYEWMGGGLKVIQQDSESITMSDDGSSQTQFSRTVYQYDDNGVLIGAEGSGLSESTDKDGKKTITESGTSYVIKDGQAVPTESVSKSYTFPKDTEAYKANGEVNASEATAVTTSKTTYTTKFLGGQWHIVKEVTEQVTEYTTEQATQGYAYSKEVKIYERAANGTITDITGEIKKQYEVVSDAKNDHYYSTLKPGESYIEYEKDPVKGWYLSRNHIESTEFQQKSDVPAKPGAAGLPSWVDASELKKLLPELDEDTEKELEKILKEKTS